MRDCAGRLDDPMGEIRQVVAASESSFTAGMRVLPAPRRAAMFAVYAYCRILDDISDGSGSPSFKLASFEHWEAEIDRVYRGEPRTAIGAELARAVERYALPRSEFELILDGMRMDVTTIVAPETEVLDRYTRRVAGAVGILSMHVFGAWRGEGSERFALSLAHGAQLINILRDVAEDAAMGRLYLPRPILSAAGMPPDPAAAPTHPNLPEARRLLGLNARSSLRRAAAEVPGHSRLRIVPALLMMGPYERLLSRMEADWTRMPPRRSVWLKMVDGMRCVATGGAA